MSKGNFPTIRMATRFTLMLLAAALLPATGALAATVTLNNPSFESPTVNGDVNAPNPLPGWQTQTNGAQIGLSDNRSSDSDQSLWVNLDNGGESFSVWQTPLSSLDAHTTYTLKFDIYNRDLGGSDDPDLYTVRGFFTRGGDGSDFSDAVGTSFTTTVDTISANSWGSDNTATFTTGSTGLGESLNIVIQGLLGSGGSLTQVGFDNVRLESAPIPEPGSLALMALGGLLIGARRRRD